MRLIYHPDAEKELIEVAQFYEHSVASVGGQVLSAADQASEAILSGPERWRILEGDVRRYLIPRFPYAIYYRALPDEVRVLAIKHHSRHPDYWRYRQTE